MASKFAALCVVALMASLSACQDPEEAFVGSFKASSGESVNHCEGEGPGVGQRSRDLAEVGYKMTRGEGLTLQTDEGCTFQLKLDGKVASAVAGQGCDKSSHKVTAKLTLQKLSVERIDDDNYRVVRVIRSDITRPDGGELACTLQEKYEAKRESR